MKRLRQMKSLLILAISTMFIVSCSNDDNTGFDMNLTPSQILSSTPWETTSAVDNTGKQVELTDPNVSNFVGFAYFKENGTFTMFNLDDSPKMQGDWSISPDGKTRTIVAKNDQGEILFTRVVDITVLTQQEFTYRIYPNEADTQVYYDIVHTPTTHQEPALSPSQILSSTPWETTKALNSQGQEVDLSDSNVINFVGFAYFNQNGTFAMYNLDDSPKMQGDWSISPDGKTRTIVAKNDQGETLFTRVVDITVLTPQEFTYRIFPEKNNTQEYYDIVHTPTTHKQPSITPSQVLSSTPWETTSAIDNNGNKVGLQDVNVINFVGYAYFKEDGTFTMYNLDDSPKMQGDWSVSADGQTRTIVAKNDQGETLFTRVVEITVLTFEEFTYRIYPDENNTEVYYDIVHTPTTHPEP